MIERFLSWWGRELRAIVPKGLRRVFAPAAVLVADVDETLRLDRRGAVTDLGALSGLEPRALRRLRSAVKSGRLPTVLCVDDAAVVRRSVSLPTAAAEDLRAVLRYEIERVTPFEAEELFFAHGPARPVSGTDRMDVDLVFTPRANVQPVLDRMADAGLPVSQLDVWERTGRAGLNLLPELVWQWTPGRRLTAGLMVLLLGLGGTWLWLQFDAQAERVEMLQAALRLERRQLIAADDRTVASAITEGAAAKAWALRKDTPMAAEIVAAATRLIPDDTWIERLSLTAKGLELTGVSANATRLIALFEADPRFAGAVFRTPVTSTGDGERFVLAVQLETLE